MTQPDLAQPQATNPATGTPSFSIAPGQHTAPANQQVPQTFTAEDIANARKQEKDKLYETLEQERKAREELTARLTSIETEREQARKQAEDADAARQALVEEQQRKAAEAEMTAKELIESRDREWNDRFAELEAQRAQEQALFQKEREAQEILAYRAAKITEHEDSLMPELRDLVAFGPSREDIDASIALLGERTARIVEQTRAMALGQRAQMPGVGVTQPPVGPLEMNSEQQSYSADEIRAMDMTTYLKNRDKLIGPAAGGRSNRGLF